MRALVLLLGLLLAINGAVLCVVISAIGANTNTVEFLFFTTAADFLCTLGCLIALCTDDLMGLKQ